MENQVRRQLELGQNLVGMMHFTGCPMLIEVMASSGMDFVNIDMEHSPIDIGLAAHLVRTADAAGITPFVRVPDVDAGLIKQVLNLGAQGSLSGTPGRRIVARRCRPSAMPLRESAVPAPRSARRSMASRTGPRGHDTPIAKSR